MSSTIRKRRSSDVGIQTEKEHCIELAATISVGHSEIVASFMGFSQEHIVQLSKNGYLLVTDIAKKSTSTKLLYTDIFNKFHCSICNISDALIVQVTPYDVYILNWPNLTVNSHLTFHDPILTILASPNNFNFVIVFNSASLNYYIHSFYNVSPITRDVLLDRWNIQVAVSSNGFFYCFRSTANCITILTPYKTTRYETEFTIHLLFFAKDRPVIIYYSLDDDCLHYLEAEKDTWKESNKKRKCNITGVILKWTYSDRHLFIADEKCLNIIGIFTHDAPKVLIHDIITSAITHIFPCPYIRDFVIIQTKTGLLTLCSIYQEIAVYSFNCVENILRVHWSKKKYECFVTTVQGNIHVYKIPDSLVGFHRTFSAKLNYALPDVYIDEKQLSDNFYNKVIFQKAYNEEHLLHTRIMIIVSHIRHRVHTHIDLVHKILVEYSSTGDDESIHTALEDIQDDLYYFYLSVSSNPPKTIPKWELSDDISKHQQLQVLRLLWEYGERWELISLYLFNSDVFANDLKIVLSKKGLFNTLSTATLASPKSLTSFNRALSILKQKKFEDALCQALASINQNPLVAPHVARRITSFNGYKTTTLLDICSRYCNDMNAALLLQWCIQFNVIDESDITFFDDPSIKNLMCISMTYQKDKIVKARMAKLTKHVVIYSRPIEKHENKPDEMHKHIIETLKKENSIIYDLIMQKWTSFPDISRIQAFEKTVFLMSPNTYYFMRNCIPSLQCKNTVVKAISHDASVLRPLFTMKVDENGRMPGVAKILNLRLPSRKKGEKILVALGGDAAAVTDVIDGKNVPVNLYCYEVLPIDYTIKPFPVHYETFRVGIATPDIKNIFDEIIRELERHDISVIFKAVDGELTMNTWFSRIFKDFLDLSIQENESFSCIIERASNIKPFPVSDLIHLFKCGRAHVHGHLTCVDPWNFICVNMSLFQEATGLVQNINDRTTQGRMSDQYALEFFSWDAFIRLIYNMRFDGAFYCLPFVCMNEAVRGKFITESERLTLLEIAWKVFVFHYNNLDHFSSMKMFPQRFSKNAIGTQFGEKSFIQRCMCTIIAYCITLKLDCQRKGLSRIGTHNLECNFGVMRNMQKANNSVECALNTAIKTSIILANNAVLDIQPKINTRENNGGVRIDRIEENAEERIFFNPDLICTVLYKLMIHAKVETESLMSFIMQINEYTRRYIKSPTTKYKLQRQNAASPLSRYLSMYSLMSSLPIVHFADSNELSPLEFYYKETKAAKNKERLALWTRAVIEIKKKMSETISSNDNENTTCVSMIKNSLKVLTSNEKETFPESVNDQLESNTQPERETETLRNDLVGESQPLERPVNSTARESITKISLSNCNDFTVESTKKQWPSISTCRGWCSLPKKKSQGHRLVHASQLMSFDMLTLDKMISEYAHQAQHMIDVHIKEIDEKRSDLFCKFSDLFTKVINIDGCCLDSIHPNYDGEEDPGYDLLQDPNNELTL